MSTLTELKLMTVSPTGLYIHARQEREKQMTTSPSQDLLMKISSGFQQL